MEVEVKTKKEYFKEYYNLHKEKMKEQITKANKLRQRDLIIEKLNNGEYDRIPFSKIKKHNIIKNENGIYY